MPFMGWFENRDRNVLTKKNPSLDLHQAFWKVAKRNTASKMHQITLPEST
jgi:hypothetical protein